MKLQKSTAKGKCGEGIQGPRCVTAGAGDFNMIYVVIPRQHRAHWHGTHTHPQPRYLAHQPTTYCHHLIRYAKKSNALLADLQSGSTPPTSFFLLRLFPLQIFFSYHAQYIYIYLVT